MTIHRQFSATSDCCFVVAHTSKYFIPQRMAVCWGSNGNDNRKSDVYWGYMAAYAYTRIRDFRFFTETNGSSPESDILNERLLDQQSLLCDVSLMRSLDHKVLLPERLLLPTKFAFSRNIASRQAAAYAFQN